MFSKEENTTLYTILHFHLQSILLENERTSDLSLTYIYTYSLMPTYHCSEDLSQRGKWGGPLSSFLSTFVQMLPLMGSAVQCHSVWSKEMSPKSIFTYRLRMSSIGISSISRRFLQWIRVMECSYIVCSLPYIQQKTKTRKTGNCSLIRVNFQTINAYTFKSNIKGLYFQTDMATKT